MKKNLVMLAAAFAMFTAIGNSAFASRDTSDPQASNLDPNAMTTNKKMSVLGEPPCPYANVNGHEKAPAIETADKSHDAGKTTR
jgi:hypothetical protein